MRKLKLKEALLKTALGYVAGKRSTRASNPALLIKRLTLIHSLRSQVQKQEPDSNGGLRTQAAEVEAPWWLGSRS